MFRALFAVRRAFKSLYRGGMLYWFGRPTLRSVHGWRLTYRLRVALVLRGGESLASLSALRTVRIWEDHEAFPRLYKLIDRAEHTVVIQMFIWRDDGVGRRMAFTLLQAADRGVRIDITKEAIGDIFEFHHDFFDTRQNDDPLWQRFWSHPRIRVHHQTNRDHAKAYIIDGRVLLITGMNVAEQYDGKLHDYLVEVRGQRHVERYLTGGELSEGRGPVRLRLNSDAVKEIRSTFVDLLSRARFSIVIEHCLFSDHEILELLARRTHEGVRVTVIIPPRTELLHSFANWEAARELMKRSNPAMLRVFVFPHIFHGKVLLVDHAIAFLGSANLITSSLDAMGEVNVLLYGAPQSAVAKLRRILRRDILMSRLLDKPPRLGVFPRLLAWLHL